jgi:hypothetical protein
MDLLKTAIKHQGLAQRRTWRLNVIYSFVGDFQFNFLLSTHLPETRATSWWASSWFVPMCHCLLVGALFSSYVGSRIMVKLILQIRSMYFVYYRIITALKPLNSVYYCISTPVTSWIAFFWSWEDISLYRANSMENVALPDVIIRIRFEYPRNSARGHSAITTCW